AIVHNGDLAGPVLETKYYRYYAHGETNGAQSALKFAIGPSAFDRVAAAYGVTIDTIDTLTDAQLAVYADTYLEYTASRQVKKVVVQGDGCSVCTGGQGAYEYSYYTNPNFGTQSPQPDDPNRFGEWRVRTTETLPDGNQNIVYLNNLGQAILSVFKNGAGQEWATFRKFDSAGRVLWVADAGTVTGRGEQYADLLHRVNGNFEFLSDTSGLITGYHYGSETTATASQPGDVQGYLKSTFRRQGELGPGYELTAGFRYYSRTANDATIYPLASETAYPIHPQSVTTTDNFSSVDGWTFVGGTWRQANGVLSQFNTDNGATKMAVLTNRAWAGADQEILASVRVDSWTSGSYARAGVSVRTSPTTGQGYGLVFSGTNQVRFVNDGVGWGSTSYSFTWQPGVWYKFRLKAEGALLLGKAWPADQAEPSGWMFTQTGWGQKPTGAPALNGGAAWTSSGSATASFKDVQVSETTYPPLPTPSATDDFSSIDGWTFVGGAWREAGGVLSQPDATHSTGKGKVAILADQAWAADQEVVASVRVDSITSGVYGRAGVTVRTDPITGLGYGLVLTGTNQIQFLNDGVILGNAYSFTWQTGAWYRLRLRAEGTTLYGKAWAVGETEPTGWMFTQTGWTQKPTGAPGLYGGAAWTGFGSATASFDDVEATAGALSATDTFGAMQPGAGWTLVGGGSWRSAGGVVAQNNTAVSDRKVAVLADRSWGQDQEIVASVRVDSWTSGIYARAGVAVRTSSTTGQGYGLVFNGTNQVRFLDDGVAWGNTYSFTWQTGIWYKFRLRIEREVLLGKVWAAGDPEPTDWMYTQTGWGSKASGAPGLHGGAAAAGAGNSTASFDDVLTAGSPPPSGTTTPTSEPFSTTQAGAGWTFVGGSWPQVGGLLAQNNTAVANVKAAVLDGPWGPDQEITASVRVDSWTSGVYARAGVSVRTNPVTGLGYGLVFNGTNQVRFLNDGVAWGNSYLFTWQTGTWYKFRLRAEGSILLGKVWLASDPEPANWAFRQDGWLDKSTGAPGLNGGAAAAGQGNSTATFDDVTAGNFVPDIGRTTSYSYQWVGGAGALHPRSVTIQAPTVSAAENGPATPDLADTVYDDHGQPVWARDGDGFLHYREFDPVTGALVKEIADVNTALTADFTGLPAGWVTPASGGAHLKTTLTVDQFGRPTGITYPNGRVDYVRYDDLTHTVRYYRGWTGTTTTGPVEVARADRVGGTVMVGGLPRTYLYTERLTMAPASIPVDGQGRPTGAEPVSNILTLSRDYTNPAGQLLWHDAYFNLAGLTYLDGSGNPVFNLGTQGTHFYRTQFTYDSRGRLNRTISPAGTTYRTDFDGLDRPTAEWVGTVDGTGGNMVQTAAYEYDGGGVGAGNLTKVTVKPGGGQPDQVSQTWYNWRNFPVASKDGVEGTEASWVNRPLVVTTFNNLGEVTRTEQYDGDQLTPTITNGEFVPLSTAARRARVDTAYDGQGRAFRVTQSAVDPVTGALTGRTLTSDLWFDRRGNVVKAAGPGGAVAKAAFDGAGRLVKEFTTDGGGDVGWADARTVTGDVVLAQVETQYDGNGNTLLVTIRDRFHDATLTGELGNPGSTSQAKARVSYAAAYHDLLGRMTAAVDVGTNGGSAWTRPATAPAGSDTVLVTAFAYHAAGWQDTVTDPKGRVAKTTYDALGGVTKTIENYIDGVPSDTDDKTIVYGFDSFGRPTTVTALLTGGQQVTESVYGGVTTANGHGLNSNDLAAEVRHPDATTGASSASVRELVLFNALAQAVQGMDRNGTVHQYTFDPVGRPLADLVTTLAAGVDGAVRRTEVGYDGQGNAHRVSTLDATTGSGYVTDVYREFNGFGQLARETQGNNGIAVLGTTPAVQYAYSGDGAGSANHSRLTSMTYPNGRVLGFNYSAGMNDAISRLSSIS
ncbi:MAG TPA: hypothetical protein VKD90_04775, partial [Gemmataceae bacterium]|nr:hypothetical protein [Gemmataceae bacterium]